MVDEQLLSQLQIKRERMHEMYKKANRNLRDEKVLQVSIELDSLINEVMKSDTFRSRPKDRKKNHPL